MKTHFADIVADENDRLKQKITEDYTNKLMVQNQRREYASQVKKPKIDESLRDKLISEIRNPTTFMGR